MYYMMLAIAASMMMTACVDEDVERSINLTGSWKGDLNMYYGIEDHRGNYFEFDAEYSDIVFYPDYDFATHGYGKQVDWYLEGPYEKQYYRFYWEILDGVLYLDYPHDPELDTAVYEYYMGRDYFSGYFKNSDYKFRLYKITDYYDWSCYHDDYMYWERSGYYSTRSADEDSTDAAPEFKVVKRGRRQP